MNTVGPYHNRQETYAYFSLPFCQGKRNLLLCDLIVLLIFVQCIQSNSNVWISVGPKQTISHYHETLGEALQGTELEFSGLEIEFKGEFQ